MSLVYVENSKCSYAFNFTGTGQGPRVGLKRSLSPTDLYEQIKGRTNRRIMGSQYTTHNQSLKQSLNHSISEMRFGDG